MNILKSHCTTKKPIVLFFGIHFFFFLLLVTQPAGSIAMFRFQRSIVVYKVNYPISRSTFHKLLAHNDANCVRFLLLLLFFNVYCRTIKIPIIIIITTTSTNRFSRRFYSDELPGKQTRNSIRLRIYYNVRIICACVREQYDSRTKVLFTAPVIRAII